MKTTQLLSLFQLFWINCGIAQGPTPISAAAVQLAQGTTLPLMVIRPLLRKGAAVHDAVYTETMAPIVQNGRVLVPAGTQLQGEIEAISTLR